jgi:hypothetical protein
MTDQLDCTCRTRQGFDVHRQPGDHKWAVTGLQRLVGFPSGSRYSRPKGLSGTSLVDFIAHDNTGRLRRLAGLHERCDFFLNGRFGCCGSRGCRSGGACYSPTTSGNRLAPQPYRAGGELWLVPPGAVFLTSARRRTFLLMSGNALCHVLVHCLCGSYKEHVIPAQLPGGRCA